MTDPIELTATLKPMIALDAALPFAWQAVAKPPSGRSFAALAAGQSAEGRHALEANRIAVALDHAASAGIGRSEALIAVPLAAGAGNADRLLTHMFRTALALRLPVDRLAIEIAVDDMTDRDAAAALVHACMVRGLTVALDRFAAGPVALHLLARFTPHFVKLDPALVRNIDARGARQPIIESVMRLARGMGVTVIATGIETRAELEAMAALGLRHVQGGQMDGQFLPPRVLRREPRTTIPTHRRLTHHLRTPAEAPRPGFQQAQLAL